MTGFTPFEPAMTGKWLELLKEIAPGVSRVLALQNPDNVGWPAQLSAMEQLAPSFKTKLTPAPVRDAAEIEQALTAFAREQNGGLLVLPDNVTVINRQRIIALAYEHRLPAIYAFRFFATSGGLVSYGTDVLQQHRFAADYVDRILKGAKPGDLPVQAPTKFELVINLKTAKALGLTVPPTLLARADEVIE
jgi:putative ABC transport system substrate-binding protein